MLNANPFARYLRFGSLSFLTILCVVAAFNRMIDPFGIYDGPHLEGINTIKPAFSSHQRQCKAIAARRIKPAAIVLGSSQAQAIDPEHPGWRSQPTQNLAFGGANLYEAYRYLQHAQKIRPLKQALLMVNLRMFSARFPVASDFEEERLAVDATGRQQPGSSSVATLFSLDGLIASIDTVWGQRNTDRIIFLPNGLSDPARDAARIRDQGGHRAASLSSEWSYYSRYYSNFSFDNERRDNWRIYRDFTALAHREGIELHIVIHPSHARQQEIIAIKGLWSLFETWKRELVRINEEESQRAGGSAFPVWDFTGYEGYVTETLPPPGDADTPMRWYWETTHYKKELGDLLLDQIFGHHEPGRRVKPGFGVLLTSGNIDEHLKKVRADRTQWRAAFPEDVAEIETLKSLR